ncbi:MAG: hypothetical protein AAF533_24995 [Acidobacteriota bacterium]
MALGGGPFGGDGPFGGAPGSPTGPPGPPQLIVTLREGWRPHEGGHLIHESGDEHRPDEHLPLGSLLRPTARHLLETAHEMLSRAERDLARSLRIVLPPGVDPEALAEVVRGWACVEKVQVGPEDVAPAGPNDLG